MQAFNLNKYERCKSKKTIDVEITPEVGLKLAQ